MARIPLKGSDRKPMPGSRTTGPTDPSERVQVSVLVRRRAQQEFKDRVKRIAAGDRSVQPLSREEYARKFGAEPADIAAIKSFAAKHSLSVIQDSEVRRTVVLSGNVAQVEAAFGIRLQNYNHLGGTYRGREGAIHLPSELGVIVDAVLGLDNRPQAMTQQHVVHGYARAFGRK